MTITGCGTRFTVDEADEETIELKYSLWLTPSTSYRSRPRNPFQSNPLGSEARIVQRCAREGRIKISRTGEVLGRSQASQLPGQLGPLAEVIFPPFSADPKQLSWERQQSYELFDLNQPSIIGPPANSITSSTTRNAEFAFSAPLEKPNEITAVLRDTIERLPLTKQTAATKITGSTNAEYEVHSTGGTAIRVSLHRSMQELTPEQRRHFSGVQFDARQIEADIFERRQTNFLVK